MAVLGEASLSRPAEDLARSLVGVSKQAWGRANGPAQHRSAWASRVTELLTMPTRFSIRLAGREWRYSFERIDSAPGTSYGRHLNGGSKDSVGDVQILVK